MFTTISKSGVGMYTVVITAALAYFGFDIDSGTLTESVIAVVNGAGAILWIIGTIFRKDLSKGIFRKVAS